LLFLLNAACLAEKQ